MCSLTTLIFSSKIFAGASTTIRVFCTMSSRSFSRLASICKLLIRSSMSSRPLSVLTCALSSYSSNFFSSLPNSFTKPFLMLWICPSTSNNLFPHCVSILVNVSSTAANASRMLLRILSTLWKSWSNDLNRLRTAPAIPNSSSRFRSENFFCSANNPSRSTSANSVSDLRLFTLFLTGHLGFA